MSYDEKAIKKYVDTHTSIQNEINRLLNNIASHNRKAVTISQKDLDDIKHILDQIKGINVRFEEQMYG